MANYLIERVPDYKTLELPNDKVRTLDGVEIDFGMLLYCKYTPERCVEYQVIVEVAFLDPITKQWSVIVLGPRMPVSAMALPVSQFVADPAEWEKFQAKRGGVPRGQSSSQAANSGDGTGPTQRRRGDSVG